MSNRELAKNLIDQISEAKLFYVIAYLQDAALSDELPNKDTLEAMHEVQDMISNSKGEHFNGSTADFFSMLAED